MALERVVFEGTFRSGSGGVFYYFTVSRDQGGRITVRDIQYPMGRLIGAETPLPQAVAADIQTAIAQVTDLVAQTSAVNGQLTFSNETVKSVTFSVPFSSTSYRVVFSVVDFVPVRVSSKTTTGFTLETGITYTGSVGYDVFV
jgi:hypothetical protein